MNGTDSKQRWAMTPTLDRRVLEELREFSDEEQDLAEELVTLFLEDSPEQLLALQTALQCANLAEVEQRSHRLKGSAGSIGALRLREICAEIESFARNGKPPDVGDTAVLREELEALRGALADFRKPAR
jgi:HPt (histidine-containing phosphotransfer) domain-containing protein